MPDPPSPKAEPSPSSQAEPSSLLPAQHWEDTALPEIADGDSAIGTEALSSTASITSSILAYRTINGRTYHSERGNAAYWGSNDDQAIDAAEILHHLCTLYLDGKLYLAPLEKDKIKVTQRTWYMDAYAVSSEDPRVIASSQRCLQRVLDVGTGVGLWVVDFADDFLDAQVIGTDVSPIQPNYLPPNAKFEIEDFTQPWTFPPNHFDFIHIRLLFGSVPDWDTLFSEAYAACVPGGWVESLEASPSLESDDGTVPPTSAMAQWGEFYIKGGRKLGRTFEVIALDIQRKAMEEAGFVDIVVKDGKVPVGGWPKDGRLKEIGVMAHATLDADWEGYVSLMANLVDGWTREEVLVYCAHIRLEARSGRCHAYYRQRVVYGRKPEGG